MEGPEVENLTGWCRCVLEILEMARRYGARDDTGNQTHTHTRVDHVLSLILSLTAELYRENVCVQWLVSGSVGR